MKKLTMFVATFALAIPAPLALPAPAMAASNAATVSFCKDYVASGYDANLTVGQCVGLVTTETHYIVNGTSAGGFFANACSYLENNYPDEFYSVYDSHAECVQDDASQLIG